MCEPRFIRCGNQTVNLNHVCGASYITGKPSPQVDHYAKLTIYTVDKREVVYWDALAEKMCKLLDDTSIDITPEQADSLPRATEAN